MKATDIADRIFEIVDQKYREQRDFAKQLNIAPSIVSSWRNHKSTSYNKRLPELANLLGTTVEYLVNGDQMPKQNEPTVDPQTAAASKLFDQLSPDQKTAALGFIEFLLSQGGGENKNQP